MENDRLKPYVHKIKGARNFAFFDILNGNFYHIKPNGNVHDLRKQLKEAGLIFSSVVPVPFKTQLNVVEKYGPFFIRNIQIHLNGILNETCWSSTKKSEPSKPISKEIVFAILSGLNGIPFGRLTIFSENVDNWVIDKFICGLSFHILQLQIEKGLDCKEIKRRFAASFNDKDIITGRELAIEEINAEPEAFFYHQSFNPCLGHQVAIDSDGMIKPCLWWPESFGNICRDSIKEMIIAGKFNPYWYASKDTFDDCKNCEYRYNCMDCRINPITQKVDLQYKPAFCHYDPLTGTGDK